MLIHIKKGKLNGTQKFYVYVNGKLKGNFWMVKSKNRGDIAYKNKFRTQPVRYKTAVQDIIHNK